MHSRGCSRSSSMKRRGAVSAAWRSWSGCATDCCWLCDGLLLLVLRHGLEHGLIQRGVFAAMQDARLEKAFTLVHLEPGKPWTLKLLCELAGISRTTLTQKFDDLVECSPME